MMATIRVCGVLVDSPHPLFGGRSYREIVSELEAALAGGATRVVLEIDSNGGEFYGARAAAKAIAEAPCEVIARVGAVCASAAYYLAAAADRIIAHPESVIGSVGVVVFPGRDREAQAAPLTPRKGAGRDDSQWGELAGDLAALMLGDLGRWRGWGDATATATATGEGAVFSGTRALEMGLIDELVTSSGGDEMSMKHTQARGPARAESEEPSPTMTTEEMASALEAAQTRIAELEEELAGLRAAEEARAEDEEETEEARDEDEDEPDDAPSASHRGAAKMKREVAALRLEIRAAQIEQLIASGMLAPGDRDVAEALYDGERRGEHALFSSRFASRKTPVLEMRRFSHGANGAPQSAADEVNSKVIAHLRATGQPDTPANRRAAWAAISGGAK